LELVAPRLLLLRSGTGRRDRHAIAALHYRGTGPLGACARARSHTLRRSRPPTNGGASPSSHIPARDRHTIWTAPLSELQGRRHCFFPLALGFGFFVPSCRAPRVRCFSSRLT